MKTIPLTQGQVALVDDADYEAVSQFKWYAHKNGRCFYAVRNLRKPDGGWGTQTLHQFLMPGVDEIDHRDGNGLNNQQEKNLRSATHQQNLQGFKRKRPDTTSKYRGVSWNRRLKKWVSQIQSDGKKIHLGLFENEADAARAFDAAARRYRGEFAHLNFP